MGNLALCVIRSKQNDSLKQKTPPRTHQKERERGGRPPYMVECPHRRRVSFFMSSAATANQPTTTREPASPFASAFRPAALCQFSF